MRCSGWRWLRRRGAGHGRRARRTSGSGTGTGTGTKLRFRKEKTTSPFGGSASRAARLGANCRGGCSPAACRAASGARDARFARRVAMDMAMDGVAPDSYAVASLSSLIARVRLARGRGRRRRRVGARARLGRRARRRGVVVRGGRGVPRRAHGRGPVASGRDARRAVHAPVALVPDAERECRPRVESHRPRDSARGFRVERLRALDDGRARRAQGALRRRSAGPPRPRTRRRCTRSATPAARARRWLCTTP